MKRIDTIKLYQDEFLAGRTEAQREAFLTKGLDKQYASIMAWKRRNEMKHEVGLPGRPRISMQGGEIIATLRKINKKLETAPELVDKDILKINVEIERMSELISNNKKYAQERLVKEMEERLVADEARFQAEQEARRKQIEELRANL